MIPRCPMVNLVSPSFPCDGGAPLHYTYPALRAIVRRSNRLTPDSQCVFHARHVSPILPGNTCRCAASSTRRVPCRTPGQGRQAGRASCHGLINKWGFDLAGIIQELTSRHDRPITISVRLQRASFGQQGDVRATKRTDMSILVESCER